MTLKVTIQDDKIIEDEYILFKYNVNEQEFWEFATEDIKCELLDGVLVIHSPASTEHEDIFAYLTTIFKYYLDYSKQGQLFGSRLVMRLGEKWNPEPDILIITPEKYKNLKKNKLEGPADIVFEIMSPSTKETDLSKKFPNFLNLGVREIWIIDPLEKTISLITKLKTLKYEDPNSEELIISTILPGLFIKPKWVWNRDLFPSYVIINELVRQ